MQFSGKEEKADSMRSNRDGIGTRVELRVGSRWTIVDTLDRLSSPGQSLQPLMLGLGGADTADYVALTWSDGVFQTELDLAATGPHRIVETQRQLSSCPVLFAWDGEQFRFVTDVLGVGGLGFFVEPGVAATPRPWEFLQLPADLLAEKDGQLVFKLSEPMEELAYIDSVRLHSYDLPDGVSMVMDDRMVIEGPAATGEPLFYERLTLPVQAVDGAGNDVTRRVSEADLKAMEVGPLDPRFIGRLAGTSVITVDFPWPLDQQSGTPILIIDGWIEYPYSQTVFAAWQADEHFLAPTLEAYGRDGYWHTVHTRFGYPAGMPRQMALPLTDLPEGSMRLRLSTNQEIYWDRIAVAHSSAVQPTHQVMVPGSALQQHTGFPRRVNGEQRVPHYDYSDRDRFWDTRYLPGYYSALGPVTELVDTTDDAVAIIGPGEEIEFSFAAPAAPAAGLHRHYVLEIRGWAKDMDMYTRNGESVGPLPVRDPQSVAKEKRDALHARYHTRYEGGR
ncbi:MAG: hypothetical protein KJO35_08165, partial [Gammaproteobacteria bacterium]|nr:hypothetical protein [Gammaproteobacteria bacterium]